MQNAKRKSKNAKWEALASVLQPPRMWRANVALISLILLAAGPLPATAAETAAEKKARCGREYAAQLQELARWCEKEDLTEQAAATRAWVVPGSPLTLLAYVPDRTSAVSETATEGPVAEWTSRFHKLRQAHARQLYELAMEAAGDREFAVAFQLVHATLREDADHESARRLLGYKLHDGKWLTQYELKNVQANQIWHERFGWLQKKHVARYEAGERLYKGRWISSDDDARMHAKIDQGWEVNSEHYQVRTNHSLEEGVRLAAQLEAFYDVWRQIFVRYYVTDEQLARMFREGAPLPRAARRHKVTCFRDREEYLQTLGHEYSSLSITKGIYLGPARTAYFFAGPEQDMANICHEATHQLFYELRPVKEAGHGANFWVIEGIACFMESYQPANCLVLLGGVEAQRLINAHNRLLRDGFYLGLADFCRLGMDALQSHPDIKQLYSQAAGMTYFLMFADDGRYRQALVDYLSTVYANRDRPDTLAELTGASYSKLDEQYQHFIRSLP